MTDEQIRAVYDLVKYAPTAFGQSPLRVVLVRSAEARQRLLTHMSERNRAKTTGAPLTALLVADDEFHHGLPRLFPTDATGQGRVLQRTRRPRPVRRVQHRAADRLLHSCGSTHSRHTHGRAGRDADERLRREGPNREFFPEGDRRVLTVVSVGRPGPDDFRPRAPRWEHAEVVSAV